MSKMTPRQQVVRFCREQGLKINGSGRCPMASTPDARWIEVFNDWKDALQFFVRARNAYIDGERYPWRA